MLMSADVREVTLLQLVSLSASFDSVDHAILLQWLEIVFGLNNTVLAWIRLFVTNCTLQQSREWVDGSWVTKIGWVTWVMGH